MKFQTIVAPTITELFERQIQSMILSGQVTPGEKLPTEAELAETMHISKSAVHAGIKSLERMGFIQVSPRHGVYIANYAEYGNVDTLIALLKYYNGTLDQYTTISLLEARDALEGLATRKFIQKCSNDDIDNLKAIIADFRNLGTRGTNADADELAELACSFHRYICFKSGNNVIPLIVNGFHEVNIVLWARWIRQVGAEEAAKVLDKFLYYMLT
jgi:DNA-binding FadR family transcriptional regulator